MPCYPIIIMTTRYSQSVWPRRWTNLISSVNCSHHEDTIITRSLCNLQHDSLPNHIAGIQCASKYDRPCVIYVFVLSRYKWENFQWFTVNKIQQKSIEKVPPFNDLLWAVLGILPKFLPQIETYCLELWLVSYKYLASFSGRGKQHYNKHKCWLSN